MTIDGLNGNAQKVGTVTVTVHGSPANSGEVKYEGDKTELSQALSGAGKKSDNQQIGVRTVTVDGTVENAGEVPYAGDTSQTEKLTPNERRAWIKEYQATHNCSKKEAKAAFDKEFGKLDKMSRKEAKAWVKDYMAQNGCSKKEAKEAFKNEFGYDVPLSFMQQIGRRALMSSGIGALMGFVDGATDGKLGVKKFTTGQGNNDIAYVKKD